MTDNRIPCPPFEQALNMVVATATSLPEQTAQHAYLDNLGNPHDLIGTVLWELRAPIREAASGTYPWNGHARARNTARFPMLWNRLFTGNPYDGRFTLFLPHNVDNAEQFLVYVLFNKVQEANDRKGATWRAAAHRGLATFKTWVNSPTSGFLVQVGRGDGKGGQHPAAPELVALKNRAVLQVDAAMDVVRGR